MLFMRKESKDRARALATRVAATSLVLALGVGTAGALPAYTSGHGDLGLAYEPGVENEVGAFYFHVHVHSPGGVVDGVVYPDEEFDADSIAITHDLSTLDRPAGAQWDFVGNTPGDPTYIFPQGNEPDLPFLGLATEELNPSDWVGNVTFRLDAVTGPGAFALFQTSGLGQPIVHWATSDGIGSGDAYAQFVGGHDHFNWSFTERGLYGVTITAAGTHVSDGAVTSTQTFFFAVPEPTSALMMVGAMGLMMRRAARRATV